MKKITVIALALAVGLILAGGTYAWWDGYGMGLVQAQTLRR